MAQDPRRRRGKYSIELSGNEADVGSLARSLEENQIRVSRSGSRYHIAPSPHNYWSLSAHELSKDVIRRLKPILFELAKRSSVSRLTLTHYPRGTMHMTSDPLQQFERFLEDGECPARRGIFFVRNEDIISGCLDCLENSNELASLVLSMKNPRIAIPVLYYALEELGKAAILFNSAAQSQASKQNVILVEGFYDHGRKLVEASYELLGTVKRVGEHGFEREEGAMRNLMFETEMRLMWDERRLDDLWALKETAVVRMFHVLLDYGAMFRDDSLYVDYDSRERKWRKPSMGWDESTCDKAARVLVMLLDGLIGELRKLGSFPSDVERLNDLLRPFAL